MPDLKSSHPRFQEGSAITEFVVVAVVLTPLMFGIPMIGKMIDLKQTTVQASRYSAWETTVNAEAQAQTLDQRFFSDASAPISESAPGANTLWGPQEPMASDGNANASLIAGGYMSDTAVEVGSGAAMNTPTAYEPGMNNGVAYAPAADDEGAAATMGKAVDALGSFVDQFGGSWNGLDTDGLIRGQASVTMQGNGWLDAQTFTQDTIIMNDNWSVSGAEQARDRVRAFVPAGVLSGLGSVLGVFGLIPGITELKVFGDDGGRRVFGYVDTEPLPPSEDLPPRQLKAYEE